MLTFEQFLIESSRSFPLYHGISANAKALSILKSSVLLPNTDHHARKLLLSRTKKFYEGISTTRNINFAKNWALASNYDVPSLGIVLELNHKAIDARYKILPVNFFVDYKNTSRGPETLGKPNLEDTFALKNEYEEFIVTDKPLPLNDKYLVAIHVSRTRYKNYKKNSILHTEADNELIELLEGKFKHKVKFY